MIEPVQMCAHVPVLFRGYAKLEQATAKLHRLDKRLHALAELKGGHPYSVQVLHRHGLCDLPPVGPDRRGDHGPPQLSDKPVVLGAGNLVLDHAVRMSRTPAQVPEELSGRLRQHLDDGQIVELTHHIAKENMRGRFNLALGIGPAGLSNGMVSALPAVHP
jgi:hypothetical protein